MSALLRIFLHNLLPILFVAATGYLLGRYLKVDPRSLSRIVFYILSPCLLFTLITQSRLNDGDILRMMGLAGFQIFFVGGFTWLAGRLLRLERRLLIAILLTTMFMNAGNFGLSLNSFAFGEAALAYASVFFAAQGILTYTLGVLIASLGTSSLKDALLRLLKIPILYALLLALVFLRAGWSTPLPIERTITLLSQAAIPSMLILLGLQLQRAHWTGKSVALALSNTTRLVISPLFALLLSRLLSLHGAARQAGILEAAMPTAVITIVLATEYNVEPAFVTTAVFTSTLISPFTLTPLLAYLGA